jgi:transglutaminase-like putative cysteine protease
VQNEIRYQWDVTGIETLHGALQVLEQRAGDCDDKVILLGALLESIGHPTQIFAMGFERGALSHVVLITSSLDGRTWWALDPTEDYPPGWCPPGIVQKMFLDNGDGDS